MARRLVTGLAAIAAAGSLAGCSNDPATSAPATVAEVGEAFLTAAYAGDTATFERLSDGDLAEARFFSALAVELDGTTSSMSCEEPRPGVAACRVTGSDRIIAALDGDREVLDLWDLVFTDLRVTDATVDVVLPPETLRYFEELFVNEPAVAEACGDFASEGDPTRCAEVLLSGLDDAG